VWLYVLVWLVLYGLYLSYVNVGQVWYAFGWESLTLEVAFLAALPRVRTTSRCPGPPC
jgi:hypothetical protein